MPFIQRQSVWNLGWAPDLSGVHSLAANRLKVMGKMHECGDAGVATG